MMYLKGELLQPTADAEAAGAAPAAHEGTRPSCGAKEAAPMRCAHARVRRARAPPLHPRLRTPIPPVAGSGCPLPRHVSGVGEGGLGWATEWRARTPSEALCHDMRGTAGAPGASSGAAAASELPPPLLRLAFAIAASEAAAVAHTPGSGCGAALSIRPAASVIASSSAIG